MNTIRNYILALHVVCFSFCAHSSVGAQADDETKNDAIALSSYFDDGFYQAQYAD